MSLRENLKPWYKFKPLRGEYGIEIEAEVKSQGDYPSGFITTKYDPDKDQNVWYCEKLPMWDIHNDDSLRDYGLEYVFKKPYSFKEALQALDEFGKATEGVPFKIDSPSTSVHCHVNILNETALTMGNFLTTYFLAENVLVEFAGEFRRSNLFALPTRVAEQTYKNVVQMFKKMEIGDHMAISWPAENVKYAALNLARLKDLGSIEIRSFRGTTDTEIIKRWIGMINQILIYSRTNGMTPKTLLSEYNNTGVHEFFSNVFGEFTYDLRQVVSDTDLENMVERKNLWYAKEIAESAQNWEKLDLIFANKEKPSRKRAEKTLPYTAIVNSDDAVSSSPPDWAAIDESLQNSPQLTPQQQPIYGIHAFQANSPVEALYPDDEEDGEEF